MIEGWRFATSARAPWKKARMRASPVRARWRWESFWVGILTSEGAGEHHVSTSSIMERSDGCAPRTRRRWRRESLSLRMAASGGGLVGERRGVRLRDFGVFEPVQRGQDAVCDAGWQFLGPLPDGGDAHPNMACHFRRGSPEEFECGSLEHGLIGACFK